MTSNCCPTSTSESPSSPLNTATSLTLPREAVRLDDSKPYVFQIVNNELRRRTLQTSISNLTQVEVTGGVPENTLVALTATNSKPLRDGLPVKVVH